MTVTVNNIRKSFGSFTALDNVSLAARPGEFLALLGPSGSGKTTLLRIMAGLDFPDAGQVRFDDEDVSTRPTRERAVGFVFQHYALFRHMTVTDNVAFGLTVKPRGERPAAAEIRRRAAELLDLVQLGHLGDRYPSQLSGGQRQRVALARALAVQPRILLLDEPFGALDAKVRKDLRRWLRQIHDDMGLTSIFVTHDQEEALDLADRVVVMNHGRIEQVGTPEEVYDQPATAYVCEFLGNANRFEGQVENGHFITGSYRVPAAVADGPALAYVRPHEFAVANVASEDAITAQIVKLSRVGPMTALECRLDSGAVLDVSLVRDNASAGWQVGASISLSPRYVRIYPAG